MYGGRHYYQADVVREGGGTYMYYTVLTYIVQHLHGLYIAYKCCTFLTCI